MQPECLTRCKILANVRMLLHFPLVVGVSDSTPLFRNDLDTYDLSAVGMSDRTLSTLRTLRSPLLG